MPRVKAERRCAVDGCSERHYVHGFCIKHASRFKRHGDPLHPKGNVIHMMTDSPTYRSWAGMLTRCTNPNASKYDRYGGRGITVCEQWKTFANFLADMGERPEGVGLGGRGLYSIERINNDGNYEPGNCRWATQAEQIANRRH